jgi:hypothetical protein
MPKQVCPGQPESLNLPKRYAGKWVAVKGKVVVGAGATMDKALAEALKKGELHTKLVRVPDTDEYYFF